MKLMKENASGILLTFILVLRYSGLRISDAAMLKISALNGDKLFLHMAKTDEPVFVPLPQELVSLLRETPTRDGYYFVAGSKRMETVTNNWRKRWTSPPLQRHFRCRAAPWRSGHQDSLDIARPCVAQGH